MLDYIRNPEEITRRSMELVRAACDLTGVPPGQEDLAVRLVHACGMPDIIPDLAWSGDVTGVGRAALKTGAAILTDGRMVAQGITAARLPAANEVICTLDAPGVRKAARTAGTTRAAAAVGLWRPRLDGAVVAIGNAPTALFRLLELLSEGAPRPAVILAFPVGFVGAVESKVALIEADLGIPYVTLRGRRGGSPLAAAALNALAAAPAWVPPEEAAP